MNSSRMKMVVAGLFAAALAGCNGNDMPHVFGGNEVPPEVMAEPRAVETPPPGAAQDQSWMRLGDVPSLPKDFTPENQILQSKQQLINDRGEADQLRQQADMPTPTPATQP